MIKAVVMLGIMILVGFGIVSIINSKSTILMGVRWELQYLVINGTKTTEFVGEQWLEFQEKTWSGFDNCNRISGEYKINQGNKLFIPLWESTLSACYVIDVSTGERTSIGDREIQDALKQIKTFEVKDKNLWIYFSDDKQNALIFSPAP